MIDEMNPEKIKKQLTKICRILTNNKEYDLANIFLNLWVSYSLALETIEKLGLKEELFEKTIQALKELEEKHEYNSSNKNQDFDIGPIEEEDLG